MAKMTFWNQLGFRAKVLLAMAAVVIPIIYILATYSYMHSKILYETQMEKGLALENELVSEKVFSLFSGKGEVVKQIAELETVKRFAESEPTRENVITNRDYELINSFLTRVQEEDRALEFLWVTFLKNDFYIGDSGVVSDAFFQVNDRPWLWKAASTSNVSFSDLYIDYKTGENTISVIYPIDRDGRRLGYVGADMYLEGIPSMINLFETDDKHHILLSSSGQVLYDSQGMWDAFDGRNLLANDSKLINTDKGNFYVEIRGVDRTGWHLVSYANESIVTKPLSNYLTTLSFTWILAGLLILFFIGMSLRPLLRDVSTIDRHVKNMEKGNLLTNMKISRKDEVGMIAQSIEQMGSRLHFKIQEMDYQAKFDQLTNLPNRLSIDTKLNEWIENHSNENDIVAVTFMDLDHFKQINDSKGHAYGDSLLIQVAERIQLLMPKNGYFGRFSGDEFIILLRAEKKNFFDIRSTLRDIHSSFLKPFVLHDHTLYVSPSMGVSLFPTDAQTREQLIANADTALNKAKENGRNRVVFFNFEMKEVFEKQLMMEQGLREAMKSDQFQLHFQPQFSLCSNHTESLEALMRWKHPEWGMISPAEFIPIAESTGHIQAIGDWVMETAIQQFKEIQKAYPHVKRIAINVSALQLREPSFLGRLKELLKKHRVEPSVIELEITESLLVDGGDEMLMKLSNLKEMGVSIALDDFGTGYSSLNYLRILPINRVKIDREFTSKIEVDPKVHAIVQSIIDLSHRLDFDVVAEGVETIGQLNQLKEWRVDVIQGYYFSRPLNQISLEAFLQKESNPT
ncbi:MAG: EAL domain-containing protein [Firmicutes bacterium]|nr:EAL domain-containing protein [Bacillota bacterium]